MNKNDTQWTQDIEAELKWDPKVNAAQVEVSVDKGTVSLMGTVDTYAEKWVAEDATKRVGGVRNVAEELTVKVHDSHQHSDSDIAAAALNAFKWDIWVPKTVTAQVQKGWITVQGQVEWKFERDSAERAVRHLSGVVSVTNAITIKPSASVAEVKEKFQAALQRQATADASSIQVGTSGGKVTLSGNASNWHAIEDAAPATWAAPGVTEVVDNIAMTGY